jgi:hypothetical protein
MRGRKDRHSRHETVTSNRPSDFFAATVVRSQGFQILIFFSVNVEGFYHSFVLQALRSPDCIVSSI